MRPNIHPCLSWQMANRRIPSQSSTTVSGMVSTSTVGWTSSYLAETLFSQSQSRMLEKVTAGHTYGPVYVRKTGWEKCKWEQNAAKGICSSVPLHSRYINCETNNFDKNPEAIWTRTVHIFKQYSPFLYVSEAFSILETALKTSSNCF